MAERRLPRPRTARPLPRDVLRMRQASRGLTALALGLGGLAAAWAGLQQPAFDLRRIRLEGELARVAPEAVARQVLPRLQGSFFTLDLAEARAAFETLPWVRRASVQRVWPQRLTVWLEAHEPAALWRGEDGAERLLNRQGEVFDANPGEVEDRRLPLLAGPTRQAAEVLEAWRRLDPLLAPLHQGLRSLSLTPRGSWRGELDDGATLEFGRGSLDELAQRTAAFAPTARELVRQHGRPLVAADLRHAEGYALRLQGLGTLAPGEKPPKDFPTTTP